MYLRVLYGAKIIEHNEKVIDDTIRVIQKKRIDIFSIIKCTDNDKN